MRNVIWAALFALTLTFFSSSDAKAGDYDDLIPALDSALADSVPLDSQVVYLDFWASWCVPCRKSFPWMNKLQERFRDQGLRVVAINLDRDRKAAEKFLQKNGTALSVIFDPKGHFAKRLHLEVMPTSFVFDRNGTLQRTNIGFDIDNAADTNDFIAALLKKEAAR